VTLHPLAEQFANVADAYERGRPEHTPAVVGALAAELGLPPGAPVLDLAAGTGKLTRALVAAGFDVTAVEPHAALRDRLAPFVAEGRALEGLAEAIPLADGSVRAVTVADAFHWFDAPAALAEIARVLEPGGGLAVLVTWPDWSGAPWAEDLGRLMSDLRPEHPQFDGPRWQDAVQEAEGWGPLREVRVIVPQDHSPERLVAYMASVSWIAAMGEQEREQALTRIAALVEVGETPAQMPMGVVIWLAQRSSR
jgi:SAM-dependent methyltransferase